MIFARCYAQVPSAITSDGTLGTVVTPDGRVFNITGGTRPGQGPNLFHSFGQFDVGTGDTAHFVGQPGIDNIIGRVTGGSASLIDGRLQSDASLFLLNPSGLMFGPNATLDVNGSFHASTADVLRFADGTAFSAHLNEKSTLTVAAPSAFGFLNEHPTSIAIEGSDLEVPEEETLSIVGGNIEVRGGTLKAPSGQVTIASVASSGEAMVNNSKPSANLDVEDFDRFGDISITQQGLIDTEGPNGGRVVLRGSHLIVDNSSIQAGTIRDIGGNKVGIDIEMSEDMLLTNGGVIRTVAQEDQDAADIRVTTGDLHMEGFSFIVSSTSSAGRAGDVAVEATNVTVLEGSQINSLTFGPGHGGNVSVQATNTVTLSGTSSDGRYPSGIFAQALDDGQEAGDAGDVTITARSMQILEGSRIDTRTLGSGDAGAITLVASDIQIAGEGTRINAGTQGLGTAGDIRIETDRLAITEGAQISTSTRGPGAGGILTVIAQESIDIIDEIGGQFRSGLFSNSGEGQGGEPTGDAGDIVIKAPQLTVDGGRVLTRTLGDGNAGNITIEVDRLELLRGGQIFNGIGNSEGDRILGNPNGTGRGGHLTVRATETVVITGEDRAGFSSGLFSSAQIGHGPGGNITLSAPQVQLADGSTVSAESTGNGDAGNIRIAAQEVTLRGGSAVTTTVEQGEASGGNIFIGGTITDDGTITEGVETLTLDGSQITANTDTGSGANITIGVQRLVLDRASALTANTGAGTGGNLRVAGAVSADGTITARADTVVLRGSDLTANAGRGTGGRIDVVTEAFLADPASDVNASSQAGGIDGIVNVEAAVSNLSEIVTPLPPDFASAALLLRDRCAAQLQEGTVSTLVARGRASVPATPEGILPSRLYQPGQASADPPKTEQQPAETIAQQQGMLAVAPLVRPQIINSPFPAHVPVALKCNWTPP